MYNMNFTTTESPLDRICREVRERDAQIVANPSQYTTTEVQAAQLAEYQRARLSIASTLRYDS